jgi:hypothetical protein
MNESTPAICQQCQRPFELPFSAAELAEMPELVEHAICNPCAAAWECVELHNLVELRELAQRP